MRGLSRAALSLTRWTSRWVPGSFTIAVHLTLIVLAAGMGVEMAVGRVHPLRAALDCVVAWGGGVWTLLEFGMQMCLVIFTGYLIAVSPLVKRGLLWIIRRPATPAGVIVTVAALAMALSWINWGLGLVTGAMLVRFTSSARKNVDYRLLVACAYLGLGVTWHAGLSGSAPLLMATPDHFLADRTGVIPVSDTIFSPFNLVLVAVVFAVVLLVVRLLVPRPGDAVTSKGEIEEELPPPARPDRPTPAWRLEHSPLPNVFIGSLGLACLIWTFATRGAELTLNTVNLAFLSLGILLQWTPASLVRSAESASRLLHGIVLQFPLYAGMFGIIKSTGLADVIAGAFISLSSRESFPLVVSWYSGLLNTFVPSGGSKWAIEAPYLLDAASHLGVPAGKVITAYAYGDMWTNLIQPFWAIPILAAARLEFKDILGYEIIIAAVYGAVLSAAMLLLGFFF
jgi:short-chain fatty acids transporter